MYCDRYEYQTRNEIEQCGHTLPAHCKAHE